MMQTDKKNPDEVLASHNLFSCLNAKEFEKLSCTFVKKHISDRDVLFQEQARFPWVALVAKGVIRVDVSHPNGTQFMLAPLSPGMMTDGEIAKRSKTPVSATAMGDSIVFLMPRESLKEAMRQNPAFLETFLQIRERSLRNITRVLLSTVSLSPEVRLARILLNFYKLFGVDGSPYLGYELPKEFLAESIACSRQTASSIVRDWSSRGWVSMKYTKIELRDLNAMCEIANWDYQRLRGELSPKISTATKVSYLP